MQDRERMVMDMKNPGEYFERLNACAQKGQILFAGSTFAYNFPIYELMQDYNIDSKIYNRSAEGLLLSDAADSLIPQIKALSPAKIFLCYGDEDIKSDGFDEDKFIAEYLKLISEIKSAAPECGIYLLPVISEQECTAELNKKLKKAFDSYVTVISIESGKSRDWREDFRAMKTFFQSERRTFGQIWNAAYGI